MVNQGGTLAEVLFEAVEFALHVADGGIDLAATVARIQGLEQFGEWFPFDRDELKDE